MHFAQSKYISVTFKGSTKLVFARNQPNVYTLLIHEIFPKQGQGFLFDLNFLKLPKFETLKLLHPNFSNIKFWTTMSKKTHTFQNTNQFQ
jgi:hypothetical protein